MVESNLDLYSNFKIAPPCANSKIVFSLTISTTDFDLIYVDYTQIGLILVDFIGIPIN